MKTFLALAALLGCTSLAQAQNLLTNGGFETGFSGWTRLDQVGSEGTFADQTGTTSPVNGLAVSAPPQGVHAAMTDAAGPGSHVLYQDFVVPTGQTQLSLQFSLYINNRATTFTTPVTLDFATPALNQQARVDVMTTSANAFTVAAADILQNVYQTAVGSAPSFGYDVMTFDLSALLTGHAGETLRLRFAEADNVGIFNMGVDNVSISVPTPATALLALPLALVNFRRRR